MAVNIPGYRIERLLGEGGMAQVFLAYQDSLARKVALKVLERKHFAKSTLSKRFLIEARIACQLEHPNIITIHDVGETPDLVYTSMAYLDGVSLQAVGDSLSFKQKIHVICDIASALDYASKKGIVHRDIKPENIMIRRSDGRAVLMDFGIAKFIETDLNLTQAGSAVGTPYFMSPEQARGKHVDHRSDIYSLGVVFFYLLTGQLPFVGDSAVSIGVKHVSQSIPLLPEALFDLQGVLDRMLAKSVTERYQGAQEVIDAIAWLTSSGVIDEVAEKERTEGRSFAGVIPAAESSVPVKKKAAEYLILTEDRVFGRKKSSLTWFTQILVLLFMVGVFLYLARPEFILPTAEKVDVIIAQLQADMSDWMSN